MTIFYNYAYDPTKQGNTTQAPTPIIVSNNTNNTYSPVTVPTLSPSCICTSSISHSPTQSLIYSYSDQADPGYRLLAGLLLPMIAFLLAWQISRVQQNVAPSPHKTRFMAAAGIGSLISYVLGENAIITATPGANLLFIIAALFLHVVMQHISGNLQRNYPRIRNNLNLSVQGFQLEQERSGQVPAVASARVDAPYPNTQNRNAAISGIFLANI